MPIKFLVLGGGVFWLLGKRGGADFIVMGARIFLTKGCLSKTGLKMVPEEIVLHGTETMYHAMSAQGWASVPTECAKTAQFLLLRLRTSTAGRKSLHFHRVGGGARSPPRGPPGTATC